MGASKLLKRPRNRLWRRCLYNQSYGVDRTDWEAAGA
jgi:hypothetical protein